MSDSPAEQTPDEKAEVIAPVPSPEVPDEKAEVTAPVPSPEAPDVVAPVAPPEVPVVKKPLVRKSLIVVTVVVLALIAALFGVRAYASSVREAKAVQISVQSNAQAEENSFKIGRTDAPVVVDVYLDFMCPACAMFEAASGDDLASLVTDGKARVRVHTMNFLDKASMGTKYSSRAAGAFAAVVAAEPDKALVFSKALFDNQPKEGTKGLTDGQIAGLATKAGISPATISDFTNPAHLQTVNDINKAAFDAGVKSTPTVLVNNRKLDGATRPGMLTKAVQAG